MYNVSKKHNVKLALNDTAYTPCLRLHRKLILAASVLKFSQINLYILKIQQIKKLQLFWWKMCLGLFFRDYAHMVCSSNLPSNSSMKNSPYKFQYPLLPTETMRSKFGVALGYKMAWAAMAYDMTNIIRMMIKYIKSFI